MTITATHHEPATTTERVLFVAFDLSAKTWQLAFPTGHGQKPRERGGAARHPVRLLPDVAQAQRRFGLPDSAPVVRGDEAGREGFWRHRFLQAPGSTNPGVASSSLEVTRRQRRAQSDALDVRQLVSRLIRFHQGAGEVGRVVHVPPVAAEDPRHRHRDLETLKQDRARTTTRLQGVLRSQGVRRTRLSQFPEPLDALRRWADAPGPMGLRQRWLRVWAPHALLRQQMAAVAAERRAWLASAPEASLEKGRPWRQRQGMGIHGAW
jgi:transposase